MTAPSNPLEVVRALGELTRQLRDQVRSYGEAEKDAAVKRSAATLAESRAFLAADGAMELRKHTARVQCERQDADAAVAEALVKVLRSRIRCIETEIDMLRTAGATYRAELSTIGLNGEGS